MSTHSSYLSSGEINEVCYTCKYFEPDYDECRGKLPIGIEVRPGTYPARVFPIVRKDDWCGSWIRSFRKGLWSPDGL